MSRIEDDTETEAILVHTFQWRLQAEAESLAEYLIAKGIRTDVSRYEVKNFEFPDEIRLFLMFVGAAGLTQLTNKTVDAVWSWFNGKRSIEQPKRTVSIYGADGNLVKRIELERDKVKDVTPTNASSIRTSRPPF